jgi:hypothetical protein
MAIGLTAMVCALAVGVASASASEFEASGGATRGTSLVKKEEFRLYPMTITCSVTATKGSVPSGKFASYVTEAKYAGCTTFGGGVKVTITPAVQYEFNAEGTAAILNAVTVTPSVLKCHYEIPAQAGFTKESIAFGDETFYGNSKFPNGQLKLNIFAELRGLKYVMHGWPCVGPPNPEGLKEGKELEEEGTEGRYVGALHEEIVGGNLTWIK